MAKESKLSAKQRKFAEVYAGNATDAARKAGYTGDDSTLGVTGGRLLRNARIAALIRGREAKELKPHIADRQERQAFWTSVMRGEGTARVDEEGNAYDDMHARLRASELLGKSNADFTEKVEHSGSLTLEQLVLASKASSAAPTAPPLEKDGSGAVPVPEPVRSFTAVCTACGEVFEPPILVNQPRAECPKCGSTELREQHLLPFATPEET